jgi:hypothetical protein
LSDAARRAARAAGPPQPARALSARRRKHAARQLLRALYSRALRITSAMPAYHSAFPKDAPSVCGLAMLPLKTRARGPAVSLDATAAAGGDEDQIDEALRLFRANVLFRNFEVQGAPDRTLIYLTLLIHQVRAAGKRGARGGGSAGAARRWPFVAGSSSNTGTARPKPRSRLRVRETTSH